MNPVEMKKMTPLDDEIIETQEWFASERFAGIRRLYVARQVVYQRGTLHQD